MATAKTCTVYVLRRSDEACPRYVGQTTRKLSQRLNSHLFEARKGADKSHRASWIRCALKEGAQIEIIPVIENAVINEDETAFIRLLRQIGLDLVNNTDGGATGLNIKRSDEFKEKCRKRMLGKRYQLGKKLSEEVRKNISLGHLEFYRKNGHPMTGKPLTDAHKEKLSRVLKGRILTEEHKQKMRKPKSPEHCAKQREVALARWAKYREQKSNGN